MEPSGCPLSNEELTVTCLAPLPLELQLHVNQVKLVDRRQHIVRQKHVIFELHLTHEYKDCRCLYIVFYGSIVFVEDTHCITYSRNIKIKSVEKYVGKKI